MLLANEVQKIPEYVLQPNAISQSMYSASTNARRLMAMAMALLPENTEDYKVQFLLHDFMDALGIERGEKTRLLIEAAAEECTGNLIKIRQPNGDYLLYTWFQKTYLTKHEAMVSPKKPLISLPHWDTITMWFNPELGDAIKAFKKAYAKIDLIDLGKLQSRYAIRFHELALSYSGFEGKNGNRCGEWYFEHSLEEIRALFQIDLKKYKQTKDFRVYVIDKPIEELNNARIGLHITPEYKRKGKWLIGARFNCRWAKRGDSIQINPATATGQEDEKLIAAFSEEFEKYKAEELSRKREQPGLFAEHPELIEEAAEGYAINKLREVHSDFLKKINSSSKKSRKTGNKKHSV